MHINILVGVSNNVVKFCNNIDYAFCMSAILYSFDRFLYIVKLKISQVVSIQHVLYCTLLYSNRAVYTLCKLGLNTFASSKWC